MSVHTHVTIGFRASPPLGVKVAPDDLETLLGALTAGEWHDLPIQDGSVRLNLSEVLFVRTERDEQRVGFGLGGP